MLRLQDQSSSVLFLNTFFVQVQECHEALVKLLMPDDAKLVENDSLLEELACQLENGYWVTMYSYDSPPHSMKLRYFLTPKEVELKKIQESDCSNLTIEWKGPYGSPDESEETKFATKKVSNLQFLLIFYMLGNPNVACN